MSHESSCSTRCRTAAAKVAVECGPTGPGQSPHGDSGSARTRNDPRVRRTVRSRSGTIPMGLCHADTIKNRQRSAGCFSSSRSFEVCFTKDASKNSGVCRNEARGVRDHNECQTCRSSLGRVPSAASWTVISRHGAESAGGGRISVNDDRVIRSISASRGKQRAASARTQPLAISANFDAATLSYRNASDVSWQRVAETLRRLRKGQFTGVASLMSEVVG